MHDLITAIPDSSPPLIPPLQVIQLVQVQVGELLFNPTLSIFELNVVLLTLLVERLVADVADVFHVRTLHFYCLRQQQKVFFKLRLSRLDVETPLYS